MKTLTTSILLSVMFLSAGAFAGNTHRAATPAIPKAENITVVLKNQVWPLAGQISVETCTVTRCIDI